MNPPLPSLPRSRGRVRVGACRSVIGSSGQTGRRTLVKELWGLDLRAQGAGVDEDDSAGDRVEGGAEMQMMVR